MHNSLPAIPVSGYFLILKLIFNTVNFIKNHLKVDNFHANWLFSIRFPAKNNH
nr:MAG TPA: hypothetical protein [Bacteriophage sp.]